MKTSLKCLAVSVGLCLSAGHLFAAETNLVQYLNVRGVLYYQGATVTNSTATTVSKLVIKSPFNNRSLIDRFASVSGNTFSTSARLIVVSELSGNEVYVMVKDGTNRVDVSSYFDVDFDNDPLVEAASHRVDTGTVSATRYQLMDLKVQDVGDFGSIGIHFDTDGLATVKRKTITYGGTLYFVDSPSCKAVTGKGKSDNLGGGDSDFLATLTFSVTGGTVEVVP